LEELTALSLTGLRGPTPKEKEGEMRGGKLGKEGEGRGGELCLCCYGGSLALPGF